jgi:hypothetical protein
MHLNVLMASRDFRFWREADLTRLSGFGLLMRPKRHAEYFGRCRLVALDVTSLRQIIMSLSEQQRTLIGTGAE